MKKIILLVFLYIFVINTGCNFHNEKNNPATPNWNTLTIESEERTVITINNDDDTSAVIVYHAGSFFSPLPKSSKIKIDTIKAYFSLAEKDTIFNIAKEIMSNPIKKAGCTDYVGDLKIVIDYGGFSDGLKMPGSFRQSIEYSGVCNWNKLSRETMQLHKILKRKMKKDYLGEHEN
jgi:hypothetical protein